MKSYLATPETIERTTSLRISQVQKPVWRFSKKFSNFYCSRYPAYSPLLSLASCRFYSISPLFLHQILFSGSMALRKAVEVAIDPKLFPLVLYKRILRLHYGLPPQVRFMGDQYVKAEFRSHKEVTNQQHLDGFFKEWMNYTTVLSKQVSFYFFVFTSFSIIFIVA